MKTLNRTGNVFKGIQAGLREMITGFDPKVPEPEGPQYWLVCITNAIAINRRNRSTESLNEILARFNCNVVVITFSKEFDSINSLQKLTSTIPNGLLLHTPNEIDIHQVFQNLESQSERVHLVFEKSG